MGVLPTRRLLTAPLETALRDIMVRRVVAIPAKRNGPRRVRILRALQIFRIPGRGRTTPRGWSGRRELVRRGNFGSESCRTRSRSSPTVPVGTTFFEALGFRLEQIRGASPWRVFRFRFPWLLVTVTAGTVCAILAGVFEATLAGSLVIAFFLTMVLGINRKRQHANDERYDSCVTLGQRDSGLVRICAPARTGNGALLGVSCGFVVCVIVWLWRHDLRAATVIGGSIAISLVTACAFGLAVPSLLHRLKLDPKIAAGPVTLVLADFIALAIYFTARGWF